MADGHLQRTMTNRGFMHLPAISGTSGYIMGKLPNGQPDFDDMTPRDHGEVRVYESSNADYPALWISVDDGEESTATLHITVENARKFAEQILHLSERHYQLRGRD